MQNLSAHNREGIEGKQTTRLWWPWLLPTAAILVACLVIVCSATVLVWSVYVTERRTSDSGIAVLAPSSATRAMTLPVHGTEIMPLLQTPTGSRPMMTATSPVVVQRPVLQTPSGAGRSATGATPHVEVISSTLTALPDAGHALTRTIQAVITSTATVRSSPTPVANVQTPLPATTTSTATPAEAIPPQPQGHIVFPAYNPATASWDLHIASVDGMERGFLRAQASQPAYSPDGRLLAFKNANPSYLGLAYLDLAGGQVVQLTHYAEDAWPSWSRDVGGMLVFSSQRQPDRRWRVYGLLATTQTDWELSRDNKPIYGHFAGWTSGNRLLYTGCVQAQCGVILADGDGSNPRPLTGQPENYTADASPDGAWIAFVKQREAGWGIYVVGSSGDVGPFALLDSAGNEGAPEWSPDGAYLGFVSDLGGVTAVWAVPFDTAHPDGRPEAFKLFDLTDLPADGWPWLAERIAWGP